tara:strand:+ start:871 stop:1731 length:861 start_codon:yes stop_codon:yes gene_type:complete
MNNIKLSILIPLYNYPIGIKQILNSINNISHELRKNIEIIISDDSDEATIDKELNNKLKKSFTNFEYIHNEVSNGGPDNWNKLISLSRGQYSWVLHHDEFWEENKNIVKYILDIINFKNPDIIILPVKKQKIILFNKIKLLIFQEHKVLNNIKMRFISRPKFLLKLNIIGPPSAIIHKKCELKYDNNLSFLVDVDYYIRLFKMFELKNIYFVRNYYTLISSQNNNNSITKLLKINIKSIKEKENIYIHKNHQYEFNLSEKLLFIYSYIILKIYSLISIKIRLKRRD